MSRLFLCAGIAATLLPVVASARAEPPAKPAAVNIPALIDKLTEVAYGDIGYSQSVSGSIFLPLDRQGQVATALLFQGPISSSESMRDLVKQGAAAVPELLKHLDDLRPTKVTVTHEGPVGFMSISTSNIRGGRRPVPPGPEDEEDPYVPVEADSLNRYTLTVGDLCYVALGQIVNRDYFAVGYMPTAIVFVTASSHSAERRAEVRREWRGLTPEKHKASLVKDFFESPSTDARIGACKRLAYYYPEVLESLAPEMLKEPTYDEEGARKFVREKLYAAADAKERRTLFDAYVAKHGRATRHGILLMLYGDLRDQDNPAEKRPRPEPGVPPVRPRECLVDLYGLPKTVKSWDGPFYEPPNSGDRSRLIEGGMVFDASEKTDRLFRDYLAGKPEDDLARACLKRLAGRGYDADIERYCRQRLKNPDENTNYCEEALAKLGRTPLHLAVERGDPDVLRASLARGVRPDAADRRGRTPLHAAAEAGQLELVRILLNAKAAVDPKDNAGATPAALASAEDNADVVKLLAGRGCSRTDVFLAALADDAEALTRLLKEDKGNLVKANKNGCSPLFLAAREGCAKAVGVLLRAGADVDAASASGWTPLQAATVGGHESVVADLLKNKADVRRRIGDKGMEAISLAAGTGRAKIVEMLLARKADPETADVESGRRPLHLAVLAGSAPTVSVLLARGVAVNAADKQGRTALHEAVRAGRPDLVRLLLDRGADVRLPLGDKRLQPLHLAALQGNRETVELLLARHADVNARSVGGNATPLHEAARAGNAEAARVLLEHGADVEALEDVLPSWDNPGLAGGWMTAGLNVAFVAMEKENKSPRLGPGNGMTPLHTASRCGRTAVVRLLLDHKAKLDATVKDTGATALQLAAVNGHVDVAELLIHRGAKVDAANLGGGTPLQLAVDHQRLKVVDLLLSNKADPNARDNQGLTALHYAAHTGDMVLIRKLIDRGADVNARTTETGSTALHCAAMSGNPGAALFFLDRGQSVHATTATGQTPLHGAAYAGRPEMVDLLLSRKADPNAREHTGKTPLHFVSEGVSADAATVERLLAGGADPNVKDNDGKTPLDLAKAIEADDVAEILKAAVARPRKPR
jgi:ankyrin repeat protein